jgi:L-lactate dehydrogenase complex protein LldG
MTVNLENINAREAILASIRASLAASAPFDAVYTGHHGHSEAASPGADTVVSPESLIDNFKQNLESVGGHCIIAANGKEASGAIEKIIERTGASKIAISDSGLARRLVPAIGEIVQNPTRDTLFGCDMGITGAQWGIAETGTLVLESEKESHRLVSLVPPVHVCILEAANIRQTLGEILELTERDLSPAVTFITGASRTSDIELTLAIGVHGPAELHAIVIRNEAESQ